jgi:hypothetical protein
VQQNTFSTLISKKQMNRTGAVQRPPDFAWRSASSTPLQATCLIKLVIKLMTQMR